MAVLQQNNKYIRFIQVQKLPKTEVYAVITTVGDSILGHVKWFGSWRQYAFFPTINTVFEKQCLRDIANFCEEITKIHKDKK